ncbi:MAG: class I SAM-dependent methyltransferase [Ignavibacteriales bacterium]|nr:MAG: class I SAM-dependent methyltransferase [Ignavibacteriales bacterium]
MTLMPLINKPELWTKADSLSQERGEFVKTLVEKFIKCENLSVLDIGCGAGGTSAVFATLNFVVSMDRTQHELIESKKNAKRIFVMSDALSLPFKPASFDLIILQDVIEHLEITSEFIPCLSCLLKKSGIIFLSTPNKLSVFNLISDPHWGFPFVSVMSRNILRKYILPVVRSEDSNRKDIARLFSLTKIYDLFYKEFEMRILTTLVVKELFTNPKGILWSKFHIFLLQSCKKLRIDSLVKKSANDDAGILNKYFTPTLYFILTKRS